MKTKYLIALAACGVGAGSLTAAPLKSAVVTTTVNDVKVSEKSSAARPASEGQKVGVASTVLTGRKSRAELTFQDKTVTRIGASSVFRFSSGTRNMNIDRGSFLLQVPKNAGGATIRTATVTAAITGTTTMMEFNPGEWIKFICLEGSAKLTNQDGDEIVIPAGQMLVMHPDARSFPDLIIINIKKMVQTSGLMDEGVFGSLDGAAMDAIAATIAGQLNRRRTGELIPQGPMREGPAPKGDNPNGGDKRTVLPDVPPSFREFQGSPVSPQD